MILEKKKQTCIKKLINMTNARKNIHACLVSQKIHVAQEKQYHANTITAETFVLAQTSPYCELFQLQFTAK